MYLLIFSELKQEIQSKERKLNPDMNESQAAAAVRRCSSFRAAVDNRLSSSAGNTPKTHTKSMLTVISVCKIPIYVYYFVDVCRFKWICCVSFPTCQIIKGWRYCWGSDEKSKCKFLDKLLLYHSSVFILYLLTGSRTQISRSQTNECGQNAELSFLTKRFMANHTSGWPSVAELCIIFKLLLRTLKSCMCVAL